MKKNTLYLVETEETIWLGTIEKIDAETIKVKSGFQGRPPVIKRGEIIEIQECKL